METTAHPRTHLTIEIPRAEIHVIATALEREAKKERRLAGRATGYMGKAKHLELATEAEQIATRLREEGRKP